MCVCVFGPTSPLPSLPSSHTSLSRTPPPTLLPGRLFYDNELVPSDSPDLRMVTYGLLGWTELPNPEFPVVFHGVEGKDEREGNSPSWFNVLEVRERGPPLPLSTSHPPTHTSPPLPTPTPFLLLPPTPLLPYPHSSSRPQIKTVLQWVEKFISQRGGNTHH